jgi:hypothetical protein
MPCFTCFPTDSGSVLANATEEWYCSDNAETYACLTSVGWVFTIVMTYLGFGCFFFATFWNANLLGKLEAIRDQWHALRNRPAAAVSGAAAA